MKNKILIASSTFGDYSDINLIKKLESKGCEVAFNTFGRKYSTSEISKIINNYNGVIAGTEGYSYNVIKNAKKLKVISRLGIGTDNIDLEFADKNKIKVFITKTTPAPAVAELSLNLMLDLYRKVSIHNHNMKNNIWSKNMGNLLKGKTLGVVGLGSIGKTFINLTNGFKFNILAYDIIKDESFAKTNQITYCDLPQLLSNADIVSIHLNLNEKTKNIINKDMLKLLKPNSIIVNTARGGIIDEDALYETLSKNLILGAGLDVFEKEPYYGKLQKLDNIILTPHIGAYAQELRVKMEKEAVENLLEGLYSDR